MICGLPAPGSSENFTLETITRRRAPVWYHVFCTRDHPNTPESFSLGWGDTRFAPLKLPDGHPVGTWYAATSERAACLESVLHDVPLDPPGVFSLADLAHYRIAALKLVDAIQCVSFHTPFLPKLHLTRGQLIDSEAACYPETRAWAQAAFDQHPSAQGIVWCSKRDDSARCLMLFQQRFRGLPIRRVLQALASSPQREQFVDLALRLGIHLI
ncbi:MAG: RES family NAD+ phosphorylase [Candidatus Accumulibacter necessarius]|jgi:hypothetical protein